MAQLIYIGGYGRSGSTLLEGLLTAHQSVVACREVVRHLRRVKSRKTCTCARLIERCPIWAPFQHGQHKLDGWNHSRLSLALLDHISSKFRVMVDSSKTAWGCGCMPFHLRRRIKRDFILVHLVRDPRAVCWSTIRTLRRGKKSGSELARHLRTLAGWISANIACEVFGFLHPQQYLRIRYEEFVQNPVAVLKPVFIRVGLDEPRFDKLGAADNRHQLHGNRMRFSPLALTQLKEDVAWKADMPRLYRWLAVALTWPIATRYGYPEH